MALVNVGTAANNTLSGVLWTPSIAAADLATIANAILDDLNVATPRSPGAFTKNGMLFVPNRGVLKLQPGDYVAYGASGWPILLSARAAATASWVVA